MKILILILVAGIAQWAFAQSDPNQRQLEATTADCEQCRAAQAAQATAQAGNLQSIGDIVKRAGPVQKPFDPDAELEHMQRTFDRQIAEVADQACGGDDADDDDDRSGGPGGGGPGGMPPGMSDDKGGGTSKGKPQDMLKKFGGNYAPMDDFLDTQEQMKKDFQKDMRRAQAKHQRACAKEKASQLADQPKRQMPGGQSGIGMGGQSDMASILNFGGGGGAGQGAAPSIFSQAGMGGGGFSGGAASYCNGGDMSSLLYSTMGMSGLASYPSLASCGGGANTASIYSPYNMMRANRFGP